MHRTFSGRELVSIGLVLACLAVRADGPADNSPDKVRPVPPRGIEVPNETRRHLTERAGWLASEMATLGETNETPGTILRRDLLPDIRIFHKAVDWALRFDEFFGTNEFAAADRLLDEATRRLNALREGKPYWTEARGLVVRGYVSRIDGSIQPYGLVVPEVYQPQDGQNYRLDLWFHGRGEKLTELTFLDERMRRVGDFAPRNAFVLHPYGRYCNGSRFAGETDAWEALADVQSRYPIDENRLVVRGFSLGGAACWHFATHHAGRWVAAAPGAGFSETAEFLRVFQDETLRPAPWEQKLWRLYDATSHAANVSMVPLVAYSGEKDRQIQAAQAMERAMAAEGLSLTHVIGAGAGHQYTADAKAEINRRIDAIAARGRNPLPHRVHFVTHSLRFNRMAWVTLEGLEQHWEPARVDALCLPAENRIQIATTNVTGLMLSMEPGLCPLDATRPVTVELNGAALSVPGPASDRSWSAWFKLTGNQWAFGDLPHDALLKRPGLQGPIDDAFFDAFMFVRPTGTPLHEGIAKWTQLEMERAIAEWRRHFRGDVKLKTDQEVTRDDMTRYHLVLWGDPQSNRVLAALNHLERLPIRWDAEWVAMGTNRYSAETHLPVFIYPNHLSGWVRYVVVNSGFTFREYDYLNNARQTPKLPDWAIIDTSSPATSRTPGGIVNAGFFDEEWQLKGDAGEVKRLK